MDEAIKKISNLYSRSRFLLACPSCFNLKPPVIVQLNTSSICCWCLRKNADEKQLFLLESQLKQGGDNVEYDVIRRCNVAPHVPKRKCNQFSGSKWKSCPNGETCKEAHSDIEFRIWNLESQFNLSRVELVERLGNSVSNERKPLKGVFHCAVCSKNLPTGRKFADHCDTISHMKLMRTSHELNWKYRPLPETDILVLCQSFKKNRKCENGDHCSKAHSQEELREWKNHLQLQNDKLKYANDAGLMTFIDKIKYEYENCSSAARVLRDSLPGVKVRIHRKLAQKIPLTAGAFAWKLKVYCNDNTEKLNHAAFWTMGGSRGAFKICRSRGSKHSKPVSHLNFGVMLDNSHSHNFYDGFGSYEVRFKANAYGFYSAFLLLEFRNCPRPLLKIGFSVDVLDVDLPMELLVTSDQNELVLGNKVLWEQQREIIRLDEEAPNDYSKALQRLARRYKDPSVALEYAVEKRENSTELFHADRLDASNYVKEMHKFLYEEEEAQIKLLNGCRCFNIAVTNDYMSAKDIHFTSNCNALYAIFELPGNLRRDTDEGLLILDSCIEVLIGRKKDPPSYPVYEAKVLQKCVDHIVLSLSDQCIQAWKLTSGAILETEIQFKLNRERFYICHYALDQLQVNKQLALVCPTILNSVDAVSSAISEENSDLDDEQKKVLAFLKSKEQGKAEETLPLLVVQGSFGTGKTYTICKCIKYLLTHDDNAKILICTHSNSAADFYISNNFDDVDQWQSKVLRIVYHGRNSETVPQLVQQYCLRNGNQFCYPTAQHIASHQVFVTTYGTALSLGNLGTGLGGCFTHIFLDEVAQVMEPSAIIPLTLANSTKTKIVIAGDHKQMTEKLYSREINEADFTLLARMCVIYSRTRQHDGSSHSLSKNLVVLRNNYRCAAPVLQVIQKLFYTESLLISRGTIQLPAGFDPIQFHDIDGRCELNQFTGGYYNKAEASCIKDLVIKLLKKYPKDLNPKDIAVVAPYRDQVDITRVTMRTAGYRDVKVETIRNIQGLEYKIVILSCVHKREMKKNTKGEKYGFLSDRKMLNTAFTRTKLGIIVVGHAVTLWSLGKYDIMWRRYIEECYHRESMHSVNDLESIKLESKLHNFPLNPRANMFVPGAQISKNLPASSSSIQSSQVSEQSFSLVVEEDAHFDDTTEELEETLPLRHDMLDDIIRKIVGINSKKLVIEVDPSGVEFATEQTEHEKSGDRDSDSNMDNKHREYSLDELNSLLISNPDDYKRCTLNIKNWYSATAKLLVPDKEFDSIRINTKRNLGHCFDQDEVVVHIRKKCLFFLFHIQVKPRLHEPQLAAETLEKDSSGDEKKLIAHGKVVGILSQYRDPYERKFICFPDPQNFGLMCPIDKKITKFIIKSRRKMKKKKTRIPIYHRIKNKRGEERLEIKRMVDYDRFAISLEKSKHFVVRFLSWPQRSFYPIGYVSEVIQPKNFERYYSFLHDVPSLNHKKSVDDNAVALANQKLDDPRTDLKDSFVFTIDPEGSTDLDDAMSLDRCTEHDECWKIGIHIADVASVVPPNSDVNLEASKRGTTFYSGNVKVRKADRKNIHMLPTCLSSRKCSLLADGVKRPAVSIFIHSSELPALRPSNVEENTASNLPTPQLTYVTSKRQLTYEEAELCLRRVRENGLRDITEFNEESLDDQLFIIWKTMLKLRFHRLSWASFHGTPEFNEIERFCDDASAHMLIEEAMITCNACCSHFLQKQGCDFLLRTQAHPLPDDSLKWKDDFIKSIKLSLFQQEYVKYLYGEDEIVEIENIFQEDEVVSIFPHVWTKIMQALARRDIETALILFSCDSIQPALSPGHSGYIKFQTKAQWQPLSEICGNNTPGQITHISLRLPFYSQFTSPIRRFNDLQSQRMILENLKNPARKTTDVIEISRPKTLNLKELSKKLIQRAEDADQYEKDVQNFSFGLSLSNKQNYEIASIKEVVKNGVLLNFLDLRDLPVVSCLLRFSEMKLLDQTEEKVIWRFRYFDAKNDDDLPVANCDDVAPNYYTSTVVSSIKWNALVRSAKAMAFNLEKLMSEQAQERLKLNFENVWSSHKVVQVCDRTKNEQVGPCQTKACRKKKICDDYLDGLSKLDIFHYRVITMPLTLGTPVSVQLYGGMVRGICVPSIQLLTVAQDLDVCIAHTSSPIETFAADVRPTPKSEFKDIENYLDHWLPLLLMDGIYNAVKDTANSTIFQNVAVTFDDTGDQLCGSFTLPSNFCGQRAMKISVDDFVCVRVKWFDRDAKQGDTSQMNEHKRAFTWVVHGVVTGDEGEITFTACTTLVDKPKIPMTILSKGKKLRAVVELIQLGVSHRGIVTSLRSVYNALKEETSKTLSNSDILAALCLDQAIDRAMSFPVDQVIGSVGESKIPGMENLLNKGQICQIRKALNSKITMIQGPPGTGKSFVGASLTYYFHQRNKLKESKKILYCGPSNKSVDVVAEYLLKSQMKVLRVYGSTFEEEDYPNPLKPNKFGKETEKRPSKKIKSITLHQIIREKNHPYSKKLREYDEKLRSRKVKGKELMKLYAEYKELLAEAKLHEVENHDVIICTCVTAAMFVTRSHPSYDHTQNEKSITTRKTEDRVRKALKFTQCIIDECGMCSEPETLAPIVASGAEQVVLIGDHKQLQPIILCKRAKEFGLDESLFERKQREAGMLTTQYRMDRGICDFPSQHFYKRRLRTDSSVCARERNRQFRFCYPHTPDTAKHTAVFCHVTGIEKVNYSLDRGGESSCYNEIEARVVIKILLYFRQNLVPLSDIMILSPYRAQVTTIRNLISKERSDLKDVHVGTVVTSQGSESDFVILSTVRSRPAAAIEDQANVQWRRKFIGFVSDPHQINVAITRARSGLCIVGDQYLLEKDTETWSKLLSAYRKRGSVVKFDDPKAPWNVKSEKTESSFTKMQEE